MSFSAEPWHGKMIPVMKPSPERTWKPLSPEMIRRYDTIMEHFPGSERRTMFGSPCSFVNGQMCAALHEDNFVLRLAEEDRHDLLQLRGPKPFEPLPGRIMREYAVVPPSVAESEEELDGWFRKAVYYARSLPPKAKKRAKR